MEILTDINKLPLNNSCWLFVTLKFIDCYYHYHSVSPNELHNETLKFYIKNRPVKIYKYNEELKKEADVDMYDRGNVIELLTVNGFYYDKCISINNVYNKNILLNNYKKIYAIIMQYSNHYMIIVKYNDNYILCNPIGCNKYDVRIINVYGNNLLIPINSNNCNLYIYNMD